ncbi:MAG: metalloregulator ArsR/SmtB family transcription factor [Bryobacteraceae bacterium]|nr:metalloregulator ArsR/SmtB family transcription factor [Bryobacteraceae bacterium]
MPRAALSETMIDAVSKRLRLLGEPQRLRILQSLDNGERTVTEIVEATGASQPNISKHLHALSEAGVVARRRDGNNVYYSLADQTVFRVFELVWKSAAPRGRGRR